MRAFPRAPTVFIRRLGAAAVTGSSTFLVLVERQGCIDCCESGNSRLDASCDIGQALEGHPS